MAKGGFVGRRRSSARCVVARWAQGMRCFSYSSAAISCWDGRDGFAREKSPGVEATVAYQMLNEKKVVAMEKGRKSMMRMRVVTVGSCRVVDEALVHSALARTTARFLVNFAPWSIYVSRGSATYMY